MPRIIYPILLSA